MITIRHAEDRGAANLGWLDTRYTFSFADYYDPRYMGFGSLRVINEDRIRAGAGFGTHGHRDMEIITYVLEGAVAHRDSLGNGSVIRPGEVQRMTAGTGIRHSEFNHSNTDTLHLLQIWIQPERQGLQPGYEQKSFPAAERRGRLRLVASRDGRDGSVTIHQDVDLYTALTGGGESTHRLAARRKAWVQVARGVVRVNGETFAAGDGAAIEDETALILDGPAGGEVLLFDMA